MHVHAAAEPRRVVPCLGEAWCGEAWRGMVWHGVRACLLVLSCLFLSKLRRDVRDVTHEVQTRRDVALAW